MPVKSNLEKRADYISISGDNDQIPCARELNVTRSNQSTHSPESSLWQSDGRIDRHLRHHHLHHLHGIRHHKRGSRPREIRSGHRALVHLPVSGHGGLQFRQHLALRRILRHNYAPDIYLAVHCVGRCIGDISNCAQIEDTPGSE